jgi:hypothetical protein
MNCSTGARGWTSDLEMRKVEVQGLTLLTWHSEGYLFACWRNIEMPNLRCSTWTAPSPPEDDWAVARGGHPPRQVPTGSRWPSALPAGWRANGVYRRQRTGTGHRRQWRIGPAGRRGLRTIAVLGCGLDTVYPERHRAWQQTSAARGPLSPTIRWAPSGARHTFRRATAIISGSLWVPWSFGGGRAQRRADHRAFCAGSGARDPLPCRQYSTNPPSEALTRSSSAAKPSLVMAVSDTS